jgi:CHAT domain-containing protein
MGAYAKAEPLLQRALAIRKKTLGSQHPETAETLNNLATLYQAAGDCAKAELMYESALAIHEHALGPDHPTTASFLTNLSLCRWSAGERTKALATLQRAQRIEEKNIEQFMLSGSEARKLAYLQQLTVDTSGKVSFSLSVKSAQAAALGLTAVLQYKGRVLDAMTNNVARMRQNIAPEDQALFDQLAEVTQQFSTLTFRDLGNLPPEKYRRLWDELAQRQETLETELSARSARFRKQVTPITIEGVRRAIPVNTVLVEWFRCRIFDPEATNLETKWSEPRYVAYVLERRGEPVAVDLGEAQPIEALIAEFRIALSDPKYTYYLEVAEELSEKLVQPLHAHLSKHERLLISPDGALNLVPFAALVDNQGKYLVQRFEIGYLTSGRDLLRLASSSASRSSAVVVADPAYGQSASLIEQPYTSKQHTRSLDLDRSGLIFNRLNATAAEAKALKALLGLDEQNVLTGVKATEAKLKQLQGPRILHVATHGFFLSDNDLSAVVGPPIGIGQMVSAIPMVENPLLRSGLALAGANARRSGTNDDGILTAAEMAQLDLFGTQLVVLSACETGVGQVLNGEGVYGMRRALVLAGTQSQLASLWKVADTVTQVLMVDFYQLLLKGQGRAEALQAVQQAMIESEDRWHPYYWSAFVSFGNWTPLPTIR